VENDLYLYVRRMNVGGTLADQREGHGEGSRMKVWVFIITKTVRNLEI
jgi:hypothetical protein